MTIHEAQDILAVLEGQEMSWEPEEYGYRETVRSELWDAIGRYFDDLRHRAERNLTHWMLCQRRQDIFYWATEAIKYHFV